MAEVLIQLLDFYPGSRHTVPMNEGKAKGCVVLSEVLVRPIQPHERARWDTLMRRHHYLSFKRTAGRALRQVAEYRGRWVALLLLPIPLKMTADSREGDRLTHRPVTGVGFLR